MMRSRSRILPQVNWQAHTYWLLAVFLLFSTACSPDWGPHPTPTMLARLTVDPVFREFYRHLGGEEVLGPPISPVYNDGPARSQYVQKAKMVYDPSNPIRQLFTLAPLGLEMGAIEPPVTPPEEGGFTYEGGHVIAPVFLPFYEKLGAYIVGKPLTELRYNPIRRRHEQFFESVGFYRLEGSDQVHLLDYGVWACGENCRQFITARDSPDGSMDQISRIDRAFDQFVRRWGADFTGFAISEPYVNKNGKWEQIFENVVLEADTPQAPASVRLRSLVPLLNIPPDPPREDSQQEDHHFIAQHGTRGYEIPENLWEYLDAHGGLELSGAPSTHLGPLQGSVLRQCFEFICLMFDQQAPPASRVRPEPIGLIYKTLYYQANHTSTRPPSELELQIWKRFPMVTPGQEQELVVSVMQGKQPLAGVQPTLILTLLDGSEQALPMDLTDASGRSSLRLAPIDAPNGSMILYKICVPLPDDQETCEEDNFILWYSS